MTTCKMNKSEFVISQNRMIADRTFMMMLVGDTTGIRPGQFVMIEMPELFLRRPISVCDSHEGLLTLVYKVVGEGTQKMAEMVEGTTLEIITGLGNGYSPLPLSLRNDHSGRFSMAEGAL